MEPEIIHILEAGDPNGIGEDVFQCCDCGAHAQTETDIKHHAICEPGESKRWEEFYNEAESILNIEHVIGELELAGLNPSLYKKAKTTNSFYIKFPDYPKLGSLRVSDHEGKAKYSYKWNMGTHIERTHKAYDILDSGARVLRRYFRADDFDWMIRLMQSMTGAKP